MTEFHLLRPLWLLALLPLAGLLLLLWRSRRGSGSWQGVINPELLRLFVQTGTHTRHNGRWLLLGLAWLVGVLGLAGPSWERLPQPVVQRQDALVVIWDLSLSMYATDIQPSRLERVRYKLSDMLNRRREGLTALVAYSGDAHVVTPLTDDVATITHLLPALNPRMMPVYGSDPVTAVEQALQLFRNANVYQGRLLLVTDGIRAQDREELASLLDGHGIDLSILGVGTETGAPIPVDGDFIHEPDGGVAIARLPRVELQGLARDVGGRYIELQVDDSDLDFLLPAPLGGEVSEALDRFDQWRDRAPWLALLLLPLAALGARRGLALGFALALALPAPDSVALEWQSLWQRPDQRGADTLAQGDAASAAQQFEDPAWRASALYRAGQYPEAAQQWQALENADAHYNRGNALARAGKLQEALDAYDKALEQRPDDADTRFNRALVEQLLQQQSQQASQQGTDSEQAQGGQQGQQGSGEGTADPAPPSGNAANDSGRDGASQPGPSEAERSPQQGSPQAGSQANTGDEPIPMPMRPDDDAGEGQQQQAQGRPRDESTDNGKERTPSTQRNGDEPLDSDPTQQWLQQIPDDPGGLLRNKFDYESRQRGQQRRRLEDQPLW